jgi:hypothetical protein
MSFITQEQLSAILDNIARDLDLSPSKYKTAVQRYQSVGNHLETGTGYPGEPNTQNIYPQGSFRLGTVVCPLREDKEGDYDIDLVFQYQTNKDDHSTQEA